MHIILSLLLLSSAQASTACKTNRDCDLFVGECGKIFAKNKNDSIPKDQAEQAGCMNLVEGKRFLKDFEAVCEKHQCVEKKLEGHLVPKY